MLGSARVVFSAAMPLACTVKCLTASLVSCHFFAQSVLRPFSLVVGVILEGSSFRVLRHPVAGTMPRELTARHLRYKRFQETVLLYWNSPTA